MAQDDIARQALDRMVDVFTKRPASALSTVGGTTVLETGLKATFSDGAHSAVMDMPPIIGGGGEGPTPGFFARAGIGGCVAIGIKMTAIRAGMTLDSVKVDVATDFDNRGMFALDGAGAAPTETRIDITVSTSAPEAEVRALIDRALAADPWFLALRDAQNARANVQIKAA